MYPSLGHLSQRIHLRLAGPAESLVPPRKIGSVTIAPSLSGHENMPSPQNLWVAL